MGVSGRSGAPDDATLPERTARLPLPPWEGAGPGNLPAAWRVP